MNGPKIDTNHYSTNVVIIVSFFTQFLCQAICTQRTPKEYT